MSLPFVNPISVDDAYRLIDLMRCGPFLRLGHNAGLLKTIWSWGSKSWK